MKFRQKKSRGLSLGINFIYFAFAAALGAASRWMANLGVVPLFLFSAFLLAPAFFAFLNLLFVVTHVLETIGKLLYNRIFDSGINTNIFSLLTLKSFKPFFLPIFNPCVKGFLIFLPLILIFGVHTSAAEDIVIGKGETLILPVSPLLKFSVGNKEVLSYKFNEKNKSLMIRGAKIGNSEIVLWKSGESTPQLKQIFVITKMQESKILQLSQSVRSLGLEVEMSLPHIRVKGVLKTKFQYSTFKKLNKKHTDVLIDETSVELNLKKKLMTEVYFQLLSDYKDLTTCSMEGPHLKCFYPANEKISEGLKQSLEDEYAVVFVEMSAQKKAQNYWFRIKLVQLEQLDGEELKLGLEELSTSIGEILSLPLNKIIEKNTILLNQRKVSISTLAQPQGIIRSMMPAEFQVGAEVPFQSFNKEGNISDTKWQFAGLKIKLNIENLGDKIQAYYEAELTKPSSDENGSISGSKGKSSLVVELHKPIVLFQMSLKTEALGTNQLPFLNKIPLLGELFKSKSSQNNFKTITAILEIKPNQEN